MEGRRAEAYLLSSFAQESDVTQNTASTNYPITTSEYSIGSSDYNFDQNLFQGPLFSLGSKIDQPTPTPLFEESSATPKKPIQKRGKDKRCSSLGNWWLEAICAVIVVGSLCAVIATVYPYNDHPLPQWPYNLSVNSLIAIYTTILKSAALVITAEGLSQMKWIWFGKHRPLNDLVSYDKASRGFWGSLRLLFRLRGRDLISSLGALITIATLLIDPFTQQAASAYTCNITETNPDHPASIPRIHLYFDNGFHEFAGIDTVPQGTQSALNAGIFNPETMTIPFVCPTGNCAFSDSYSSIGFCSSCSDLTGDLHVVNSTMLITQPGLNYSSPIQYTNTSLPSGLNAVYVSNCFGTFYGGGQGGQQDVNQTLFVMGSQQTTRSGNTIQAILGDTSFDDALLKQCSGPDQFMSSSSWACSAAGRGAAQCTLYPCVREYTANVVGGRLTEKVISVSPPALAWGFDGEFDFMSLVKVDCLSTADRELLSQEGYSLSADTKWLPYNKTFNFYTDGKEASSAGPLVDPHCIYEYFFPSLFGLYRFFTEFFDVSTYPYGDSFDGPSVAQAFYNSGNVNYESVKSTFENIAQSLTIRVRTIGNVPYSQPALGQVINRETCVRVRWAWLAYLASVVLLLILFFAMMVVETGRHVRQTHCWKSSPLALIYHGLDQDLKDRLDGEDLVDNEAMGRHSRKLVVKLMQMERGWAFTEASK